MPVLFDTSGIPDQPEYWDALSERVSAEVQRPASTFRLIAESRVSWTVAGLAAAAAIALLLLPPRAGANTEMAGLLTPSDRLSKVITSADGPPELGELLMSRPTTGGAR